MKVVKYLYLGFGVVLFIGVNIFSFTTSYNNAEIGMKILFSSISFVLMLLNYASIVCTKKLYKREFSDFTTYFKITLYLGVIIIPLISLYYR